MYLHVPYTKCKYISFMSTVWLQIMWNPLMWRFIKDMNNRMANKLFLFLFLNLDKVKNWTPGRITNIWQIQLVQIDTKVWKDANSLFSDIFIAFVIIIALAPYFYYDNPLSGQLS